MTSPAAGSRYRYSNTLGLAEHHASGALTAEMTELDMRPGTEVTVTDVDDERGGLVLVEWADRSSNPRITSVDPELFEWAFEPIGEDEG